VEVGKYLSLEEARGDSKLMKRLIKEIPSESDFDRFNRLLVVRTKPSGSGEGEGT
jgi:hypothetical protein